MNAGALRSHLEAYIELRRSLSFKQPSALKNALQDFIDYVAKHDQHGPILASIAVDWAREASSRCYRSGAAHRLRFLRGFLIYLKAFEPETEIPSPRLVVEPRRPKAQLYSPEQITRMMETEQDWFWEPGSFRQKTYRTVVGLLASTGLRIGEALRLTLDHRPLAGP